jgi:dolichol-phosphate mannosyltransferase
MSRDLLVFIPTYNERENVEPIYRQLSALGTRADFLFLDDNSPDGTGQALDGLAAQNPNLHVIHRAGKLGIGTAHAQGIAWAYEHGYRRLLTMDCDFTHSPDYVKRFLEFGEKFDVSVGSRFLQPKSLAEWNLWRKFLTHMGFFLTRHLLGMPYDATGAYRLYRLDRLPRNFTDPVYSRGYSFFFESLFVLHFNKFSIGQIPIHLPARAYGHSKMRIKDMVISVLHLFHLYFTRHLNPERITLAEPFAGKRDEALADPQGWAGYWSRKSGPGLMVYDLVAAFYRKYIIRPALNHYIRKYFRNGASLLHAGCGSGQVDRELGRTMAITALDISPEALSIYRRSNPAARELIHGSIFDIPAGEGTFDGAYNLGVMEHFTEPQIVEILRQMRRVVKPGGRIVLFWPPEFGLSVNVIRVIHFLLHRVLRKQVSLHPPEITRVTSRRQVERLLADGGFRLAGYHFGPRDVFTHVIVAGVSA